MAGNRKFSIMKNTSHVDRPSNQIRELRLSAGDERDELLRQARQDEIARRSIEWVTASDQDLPSNDVFRSGDTGDTGNDATRRSCGELRGSLAHGRSDTVS